MDNKRFSVRSLVQASFFVGLSVVLTRLGSVMILPTIRFGFGEIPIMLSGMFFGPFIGVCVGFIADLVGFMINSNGAEFHLGFTISSMLWGLIPGLLMIIFNKTKEPYDVKKIFVVVLVSRVVISLGLNTYWLSILYGKAYKIIFIERVVTSFVQIPIETFIIMTLAKNLNKIITYD